MKKRVWSVGAASIVLTAAGSVALPQAALAAPACSALPTGSPAKVAQLSGWAESLVVDGSGRMFVTNLYDGRVYRIDRPGATPVAITGDLQATGGILIRPDGKLLVGTENGGGSITSGKVLLVDTDTGAASTYADGLQGINGIALAADGTIYTTTGPGQNAIGRVTPDGVVNPTWASVPSGNGISASPDGQHVYVIQTAVASSLYRISVNDPASAAPWVSAGLDDALALPDDIGLDSRARVVVATHADGILRVENGRFCTVQSGLLFSTAVAYGHSSTGFSAGRLYRSGADGSIYEIPAGFDPTGQ